MRLICPNCGAQYEVPDDVIPAAGRDVQCSNCGNTWFEQPGASVKAEGDVRPSPLPDSAQAAARQMPAAKQPPAEPTPAHTAPAAEQVAQPVSTPSDFRPGLNDLPLRDDIPVPDAPPVTDPDYEEDETLAPDAMAAIAAMMRGQSGPTVAPEPAVLQRRGIDPEVAGILRQEAALEDARRRGAGGIESQPDLGIERPMDPERQRAEEARRRLALLKGENPNPAPITRRERLPDIEEINSTLRATSERNDASHIDEAEAAPRRKRGFRSGFRLVLVLAALGLLVYATAPRIAAAVPALEPTLTTYVAKVDDGRLWLDRQMRTLLEKLTSDGATAAPEAAGAAPATATDTPIAPEAPATN